MARILVAGGLHGNDRDEQLDTARARFASALGRELIARNHTLLGGCRTALDAAVATAATEEATRRNLRPQSHIRSWVTQSTKPTHRCGEILRSRVTDWQHVPRGFAYPEPVHEADVVIIIGGWEGTHYAASWARLANKPLVPVAAFGLAAAEIFDDEVANFDRRYTARLSPEEYHTLNRVLPDYEPETVDAFAADVLSLAERLITPTEAFVIMSFSEEGHLTDAFDTIKRVCAANQFQAYKIDQHVDPQQRIVPSIMKAIRRAAFIIADVSEPRPNVYYELGYAQALGKDVITTAYKGTQLPFDIYDVPVHFWDSQGMLERKLQAEIKAIASKFGR